MSNISQKKNRIWPIIWTAIFLSFIVSDLIFKFFFYEKDIYKIIMFGSDSYRISVLENGTFIGVKILKLLGIFLNIIYSLKYNKKDYFLNITLALTLAADTFFSFNPASAIAVLIFCFVQYSHSVRFSDNKKINTVRAVVFILFLIAGFVSSMSNIYAFAYVYTVLIAGNIHLSYRKLEKEKAGENARRLAFAFAGFILFFLCDVNIALTFYSATGILPDSFNRILSFLAWFFYYPSQILLINSSLKSNN